LAQRAPLRAHQFVTWINGGIRPDAYAHELYAHLRALDRSACARILVQAVPEEERWDAVRDRLTRAAAASAADPMAEAAAEGSDDSAGEDDSLAVNVVS
jgi:L-threonylcarbamoyladenylate synthase